LETAIQRAILTLPERGYTDGKRAVGYDLDGDGIKEYFVSLQDMGIGDNYFWGIFSVKPLKFLGVIPAEHIYIAKRRSGFPTLISNWHKSVSEFSVSSFSFRRGRYRRDRGEYLASVYLKNEPKYSARTTDLYLCSRDINYK
jgi:hypothetical protein